jgi:hypothetical protein
VRGRAARQDRHQCFRDWFLSAVDLTVGPVVGLTVGLVVACPFPGFASTVAGCVSAAQ